jgi:hypothetical protein
LTRLQEQFVFDLNQTSKKYLPEIQNWNKDTYLAQKLDLSLVELLGRLQRPVSEIPHKSKMSRSVPKL